MKIPALNRPSSDAVSNMSGPDEAEMCRHERQRKANQTEQRDDTKIGRLLIGAKSNGGLNESGHYPFPLSAWCGPGRVDRRASIVSTGLRGQSFWFRRNLARPAARTRVGSPLPSVASFKSRQRMAQQANSASADAEIRPCASRCNNASLGTTRGFRAITSKARLTSGAIFALQFEQDWRTSGLVGGWRTRPLQRLARLYRRRT
jgi:hypothetical protein